MNDSQSSMDKTEDTSVMRELIVKLDEVKIALNVNKTQREVSDGLTKVGARPKTGTPIFKNNKYNWAPEGLQENLRDVGITLSTMESIKKALIELTNSTKENSKDENVEEVEKAV